MTIALLIISSLLLVAAATAVLLHVVRSDGYGRRTPPVSHHQDVFAQRRLA